MGQTVWVSIKDGAGGLRQMLFNAVGSVTSGPFAFLHGLVDDTGNLISSRNPLPVAIGAGLTASGQSPVTGSLTSAVSSAAFTPLAGRSFNITLRGTFVGTVIVERCLDGTNWDAITAGGQPTFTFTAPCSESFEEAEVGAQYRLRCTAYTSGTIIYRISQ